MFRGKFLSAGAFVFCFFTLSYCGGQEEESSSQIKSYRQSSSNRQIVSRTKKDTNNSSNDDSLIKKTRKKVNDYLSRKVTYPTATSTRDPQGAQSRGTKLDGIEKLGETAAGIGRFNDGYWQNTNSNCGKTAICQDP